MGTGPDGTTSQPPTGAGRALRTFAFPVAFAALLALQIALVFHFAPPAALASDVPVPLAEADTPAGAARTASAAPWTAAMGGIYDPLRLAGAPAGTIYDCGSPAWTLFATGLSRIGVPFGWAYNLFILLVHLSAPWLIFAAARLFRLDRWTALVAATLATAVWFFDSATHWSWWVGRMGFLGAACLLPLALALFHRVAAEGRLRHTITLGAVLAALPLCHPLVALVAIPACLVVWRAHAPTLDRTRRIRLAAAAVAALAANAWWLVGALAAVGSAGGLDGAPGGPMDALTDMLGLLAPDPRASGWIANRTAFRLLVLAAAVVGLLSWRRSGDSRFRPLAVAAGTGLALAYLGGLVPLLRGVAPYRFVVPAALVATVPAAAALVSLARALARSSLSRLGWGLLGLGSLVAVPTLARDVLYFFPSAVPDPAPEVAHPFLLAGFQDKGHMEFRHRAAPEDFDTVVRWLESHREEGRRVLVEWPELGEYLLWRTDLDVLGGAQGVRLEHAAADLFRRLSDRRVEPAELRALLTGFGIDWIVVSRAPLVAEKWTGLLEPTAWLPPCHRIYRSRARRGPEVDNEGRVEPEAGGFAVRGTDPRRDAVVRYHWDPALRCTPGCRVVREPAAEDPVGFLRIPAPHPADFAVRVPR